MVEERIEREERQAESAEDRSPKKVKLEPTAIDDELKVKIAKQIDYYFSDVNLVKDKFMREHLDKNDNCVKLSVLLTFARLAQLTKFEEVIVESLKDYPSENMELDAENKFIRRKRPLPSEDFQKELQLRTVHISGFPDTIKFDDLMRFCGRYGEVESLSMRQHYKTKQFKGCIHVSYKSREGAEAVLNAEVLLFKDRELKRESMEQYHKRKDDIRRERMEKRKKNK